MLPGDAVLSWRVLSTPRLGHREAEYEDAWAADPAAGRFAVGDGASETSFADLWARLLAEGFVAAADAAGLSDWLDGPRRLWDAEVAGIDLPWYAEMKREQGAFATLLGLGVRLPAGGRPGAWRAEAVGDTCLVRVRKGRFLRTFPLAHSAEFGSQPDLIGSRAGPTPTPARTTGSLLVGDRFLLMTDALAHWFFQTRERGGRPWEAVAEVATAARPEDDFAALVEGLREGGALRNDDVTLLAIDIESAPTPEE